MVKIVLCIVLVLATYLVGNSFAQRLSNRCKHLRDLIESINIMKSLISFSAPDIHQVVSESFRKSRFNTYFEPLRFAETDFSQSWKEWVQTIDKSTGLTSQDKDLLQKFGEGLGITDVSGQLAHLDLYSELFAHNLADAQSCVKDKSKLYRVLGFSLGCTAVLVIV